MLGIPVVVTDPNQVLDPKNQGESARVVGWGSDKQPAQVGVKNGE